MIQLAPEELIASLIERARQSPRQRINHNFHSGPTDNPHRFLNVLIRGTYIRPHRHIDPPKSEGFVILSGAARVVVFDDDGAITSVHHLAANRPGVSPLIDLAPGIWHTIIAETDSVVCYEVKPGPWKPATDKDFAPWAPGEGDPAAVEFLERLTAASQEIETARGSEWLPSRVVGR